MESCEIIGFGIYAYKVITNMYSYAYVISFVYRCIYIYTFIFIVTFTFTVTFIVTGTGTGRVTNIYYETKGLKEKRINTCTVMQK